MKTWLTSNEAGQQENVAWIELDDGRMFRLTEDGRLEVESNASSRIVKRLLIVEQNNWVRIS